MGLAALIAFAALEAGVRAMDRWNLWNGGDYMTAPGIAFKLNPNGSLRGELNRDGFRDLDRSFEKPPGNYRVLFLGDSFVWGVVKREETFASLIEADLNASASALPPETSAPASQSAPARRVEIINLGVPGYGPVESLNLWRNYGVKYHPDAVIYGFYYGNDLTDDNPAAYQRALLGELVTIRRDSLLDRSRALNFLRSRWIKARYALTHKKDDPAMTAADRKRNLVAHLALFDTKLDGFYQAATDLLRGAFTQMRALAEETHTPLLVARYPSQFMVDPPAARRVLAEIGRRPEELEMKKPVARVGALLGELGIETVDITPEIEAGQAAGQLFSPKDDTHFNPIGNRVAADALLPAVRRFLGEHGMAFGPATEVK